VSVRRACRVAGVVSVFLGTLAVGWTTPQGHGSDDEHRRLVARYRSGEREAARDLAKALGSGAPLPRNWCGTGEVCEAACVANLDAAGLLLGVTQADRAEDLVDATVPLVNRQATDFRLDWLLAAGYLHQGFGNHARAFAFYSAALELRPGDASALLARATALEFSVLPDGFGGVVVGDRDVWRFLEPGSEPPRELAYQLANARTETPYRRLLLEFVTRQYRDVLELDPTQAEARLRLGRVLEARGHRDEAVVELRAVAAGTGDPYLVALGRLCLARLETSPDAAAAAYRSALEVDPSLRPAWLGLSRALHGSGEREAAVAALEHALSPDEPRPLDVWVEYHFGRGRAFPGVLARLRARLTRPD
jgi:tetratricopeptide (TPR) repeat protein